MAILKIARSGHPVLRRVAEPVDPAEIKAESVQQLINDLIDTCEDARGAGLAAPQVHVSRRVVLMDLSENPRYPGSGNFPRLIAINPVVTPITDQRQWVWEGCLSIPGLRGRVPRARAVRLEALDGQGETLSLELEGFPAAVVQHECDHLDGKLFVDRMETMESLCFLEEYARYVAPGLSSPVENEEGS